MKIDLTELLRQTGNEADIENEDPVSFPEDGLGLTQPVKFHIHLTNTGTSVLLNGTLKTEVELECSRCLTRYKAPLSINVAEEYAKSPPTLPVGPKKERELKEEDFVYPIDEDNALDLDETIRQNLLLALPIKTLCRADCPIVSP